MRRGKLALIVAALVVCTSLTYFYLRSVNISILEPAGPIALEERTIMITATLLCALIVVPVFFMLFFFAWKYRASNPDADRRHHPEWDHYDVISEAIWWIAPATIIAILGVIAWRSSHALDPYRPIEGGYGAPLAIEVVSLDWKWLFIYPAQGIASVNFVEFPVNTPIHFYLTSDAPMNSFWIPQLAGQIMTMPGMTTQLDLAASREGDFNGFSSNISGDGFAGMAFTARALSQAQFDLWVASVRSSSSTLSQAAYQSLAQPSEYNPVQTFSQVAPNLFNTIEAKYSVPGSAISISMMNQTADMQSGAAATTSTP